MKQRENIVQKQVAVGREFKVCLLAELGYAA